MTDVIDKPTTSPISTTRHGDVLIVTSNNPPVNALGAAVRQGLVAAIEEADKDEAVKAVVIRCEGQTFFAGADISEFGKPMVMPMLPQVVDIIENCSKPVVAAIHGTALGGGLEVALATTMIFATPDATLGQPEMKLGVFAPAASCLLPHRVGQAAAEDLLFSGRTIGGAEAKAIGLVDVLADDPAQAALAYFDAHLAPRSAAALAFAIQAVRAPLAASVASRLADVERLYVNALMKTRDANEGIAAFLAKRQPSWEHR